MTALAVLYSRHGDRPSPEMLEPMLSAMAHRAVDGTDTRAAGAAILGHLHFWTTPEEVGERQPLGEDRSGLNVAFCGRLDNRAELAAALGLGGGELDSISDAAVFLRAFERWQDEVFAKLLGPFAVVVVDGRRQRVVCARDIMGDRGFFFHLRAGLFAAASEEAALLAIPGVSAQIDEESLARFFAPEEPAAGSTFFAEVKELPAGHALEVSAERFRQWRYGAVPGGEGPRYRRDQEYLEHFRELLGDAVRARLRSVGPAAVMMSGGLDSTSVAALASRAVRSRGARLLTVSYVFDELRSCDESAYIDEMAATVGLDAVTIAGDQLWPLKAIQSWPRNPNTPLEGPYRRLREELYRAAANRGVRALLTGEFGDELYAGGEYWLRDLLRESRWATALGAIGTDRWFRLRGLRPGPHGLRSSVGRALGRVTTSFSAPFRPWLTRRAAADLEGINEAPPAEAARPSQSWAVLHPSAAWGNVTEPFHSDRAGIEVRRPFRDRRLIEFALSIPAHLLYRPGGSKWILRQAMRGHLPELVLRRQDPTSLLELLQRGLRQQDGRTAESLLFAPDALWRPYVSESWLRSEFPRCLAGPDGSALVVVWRCLCVELWRQSGLGLATPLGHALSSRQEAAHEI